MYIEILSILITVIWIIIGTSYFKLNPLVVVFFGCIILGLISDLEPIKISNAIYDGFISTTKKIGLIIIFGIIIGIGLEKSGATKVISVGLLKKFYFLPSAYAINLIGFIISIPVFCDAAFIVLSSLNKKISELTFSSKKTTAIALSTGLFAPHVLVPPTPGPLAAAAGIDLKNIFFLFVFGGIFALILSLIGSLYAQTFIKKTKPISKKDLEILISESNINDLMSFKKASSPIWIPIILMSLSPLSPDDIRFFTSPTFALFTGASISMFFLLKDVKFEQILTMTFRQSLPIIGITGMGGALGQIIKNINVVEWFSEIDNISSLGIIIPFLISASLKTAQGSSTVAIITSTSIVYPILHLFGLDSELGKIITIMSIGVGSMTVSHANDSYFWIVSQFSGMNISDTYKTHTIATLVQGLSGIIILFIFNKIILLF
tara:strand:+ start:2147 stop:3448 length:1302 start_codon:yes stop_codon:yes gene_type:complete